MRCESPYAHLVVDVREVMHAALHDADYVEREGAPAKCECKPGYTGDLKYDDKMMMWLGDCRTKIRCNVPHARFVFLEVKVEDFSSSSSDSSSSSSEAESKEKKSSSEEESKESSSSEIEKKSSEDKNSSESAKKSSSESKSRRMLESEEIAWRF